LDFHGEAYRLFRRSIALQSQLNLPGVVKIIGILRIVPEDKKARFFTVTECMPHGSFEELISERLMSNNPPTFCPTAFSKIIFGVAVTMSEIHSRGVLHRDLKPYNISLDENDEPRIHDFCVARFNSDCAELIRMCGTPLFMAAELLGDPSYENRIDVFSYGVLLYMIFTGKRELSAGSGRIRSMQHLLTAVGSGKMLHWQPEIPEAFWKLITLCWKQEPEKRPSFHEITEMMLRSDDLTFPGTDLDEYHEYQSRIIRETNDSSIRDPSIILKFLADIGVDFGSIPGLH
jgi:serine/threonine protein kinase